MVAYWLWAIQKIFSHFYDFKQVKKLIVILLLIVGHGCFLDFLFYAYLSRSFLVYVHVFWNGNFEMHFLGEQFWIVPMFWEINIFYQHQTYFLLKPRKQKYSQFLFLILYLHCWYTNSILYFYNFIFSVLNKTTKCNCAVIIIQSNTYYGYVSFNQNWFHKRYSKSVLQTLLKISSASVTQN